MTRLYLWAGSVVGVIALLAGIWWIGWGVGRSAEKSAQDRAYIDTMERTNDADISSGDAADDADWLHRRGQR